MIKRATRAAQAEARVADLGDAVFHFRRGFREARYNTGQAVGATPRVLEALLLVAGGLAVIGAGWVLLNGRTSHGPRVAESLGLTS